MLHTIINLLVTKLAKLIFEKYIFFAKTLEGEVEGR